MTLSFSQKWPERMGNLAGKPNYFLNKIVHSFFVSGIFHPADLLKYSYDHEKRFGLNYKDIFHGNKLIPKIHTIREDKNNRWKKGNKIHFVINNRTKDRFQFAPVVKCVSVQKIEIKSLSGITGKYPSIFIDGHLIGDKRIKALVENDGFPSVDSFFKWFPSEYKGKIIHWTDLKY